MYSDGYTQLQQNAYMFVLPDEVGGTHPALVEAMGYGNCVLVNDTASNLEVIANSGFHYSGKAGHADLQRRLQHLLETPELVAEYRIRAYQRAKTYYRWEDVVQQHANLYRHVLGDASAIEASQMLPSGS